MNSILKACIVSILFVGVLSALLSFNLFDSVSLYKLKDIEGQRYKFYVLDKEKATDLIKNYQVEDEEDNFSIVNFIEKLNGDFKLEY